MGYRPIRRALAITAAAGVAATVGSSLPSSAAPTQPAAAGTIASATSASKAGSARVDWTGELASGTGSAVSQRACDVNNDGHDDVVVGAWFWDKAPKDNVGGAYVVLGSDRPAGGDLTAPSRASSVRINGSSLAGSVTGFSVACLGDTNRDGFDDLAIGDYVSNQVFVIYGEHIFEELNLDYLGDRGYRIKAPSAGGNFGYSVSALGDINNDAQADLAIAEIVADTRGRTNNGRVWLVAGGSGTADVVADGGRSLGTIDGAADQNRLSVVSAAGDVNHDSRPDLVLGAYTAEPHGPSAPAAGAAYVVYGTRKGNVGAVDTAGLAGRGFVITGPARGRDRLGMSVAAAGDLNRDGYADVIVGADGVSNAATGPRSGGAAIIYGSRSNATVSVDPASATPIASDGETRGWWIEGAAEGDGTGFSVAGIGDVNTDSVPDLLVGAWSADVTSAAGATLAGAGTAYVIHGQQTAARIDLATLKKRQGERIDGTYANQRFGRAVGSAGDFDGNRRADVVIGGDAVSARQNAHGGATIRLTGPLNQRGSTTGIATSSDDAAATANGVRAGIPGSAAFTTLNWVPTETDTCPASLHATYSMVANDGKQYPTWHPTSVTNPATGTSCTFGHEHGDNPRASQIYDWASAFLSDRSAKSAGVPFGMVAEASMTHEGGHQMRQEDHGGHKVIVENDVVQLDAVTRAPVRVEGNAVTCDYLVKIHQGSHSADATKNSAHELVYAVKCTDGTELISSTLTLFGQPNEFTRSCDGTKVTTSGSTNPAGYGGRRLIPDTTCIDRHVLVPDTKRSDLWALYEVWESANELTAHDGTVLASYDPWFAVRNPSRYADTANPGSALPTIGTGWATKANGDRARGLPWSALPSTPQGQRWVDSPFNGAQRDHYLAGTVLDNASGAKVWWSSPYGDHATQTPHADGHHGLVKQHVARKDTTGRPAVARFNLGLSTDYGPRGSGVHAPN